MRFVSSSLLFTGASLAALIGAASPGAAQQVQDEIVVTATGRAAAIQDVPLAVTAVTAEAVENAGIQDIRDLQQVAPSYRFLTGQSNAAGTSATIRGIGTAADNPGFESAVGFFIDGVYRARSGAALANLPEVERIEVLRGPQGTLFGRNTTAGAISITTAGPEFTTRAFGELTFGNYGLLSSTIGITGPVIEDTLALRLEASGESRDGFVTDVVSGRDVNNRDRYSVRGQALWDITPDMSLRVIADGAASDEECCTAVIVREGPTETALDLIARSVYGQDARPPLDPEARRTSISPNRTLQEATEEWGVSAQLDWTIGTVQFTSISAYRDWDAERGQDIDFSIVDRAYREGYQIGFETLTQEFRLQGEAGRLDWLVGAFYGEEASNLRDTVRVGREGATYVDFLLAGAGLGGIYGTPGTGNLFAAAAPIGAALRAGLTAQLTPALGAAGAAAAANAIVTGYGNALLATRPTAGSGQVADVFEVDTQTLAFFTHNVLSLTDKLDLTVGLRYNNEQKDLTANLNSNFASCAVLRNTAQIVPGIPVTFAQITQSLIDAGAATVPLVACNPVANTVANGIFRDSREDKEWNGTISLGYKPNEDLLLYASASRGYKGGGYNMDRSGLPLTFTGTTPPPISALEFAPEFVNAYEVGWKLSLPAVRGALNGAIFYQQFEDFQLLAFTGFNFQNRNIAEVTSQGVELETALRPVDGLTLTGGVVYNKTEVGDHPSAVIVSANGVEDLRGQPVNQAPEWIVSGALTYERPIGDNLTGLVYVDGRWNSEHRTQALGRDPLGSTDNDAFAIFNARVGIGHESGSWRLEAFVRNITDEFYALAAFQVPEQAGTYAVYPSEPRTYGVTLRTSF